ncbi:hypothetical protein [Roseomonas sp. USHLN139]|uniref:hypothetical protein n=1 Tax=Roseomonas sp. USHLN139 TaxID=3081298 RepID=UPI003B02C4C4
MSAEALRLVDGTVGRRLPVGPPLWPAQASTLPPLSLQLPIPPPDAPPPVPPIPPPAPGPDLPEPPITDPPGPDQPTPDAPDIPPMGDPPGEPPLRMN